MTDIAADVVAELEAEDAKEAAELAERQRRRREALVPAMALSREILAAREEFLSADRERVDQLTALVKAARKSGAPKARLDELMVEPLAGRKRAPRRTKRTEPKLESGAQSAAPPVGETPSSPVAV